MIPHSEEAVQVTQHFANHFIRFGVVTSYYRFHFVMIYLAICGSTHHRNHSFVEIYSKSLIIRKLHTSFLLLSVTLLMATCIQANAIFFYAIM
jgi:hypothetical protein